MAFFEYGVGGNEVRTDVSESISDIPVNRTLLVEQLTAEEPLNPEKAEKLETIESVFQHFKPNIDVTFENEDGQEIEENFRFETVADFLVTKMTQSSPFLKNLNDQKDFYNKTLKQLRSNKILQRALQDGDSRQAIIEAIQSLMAELESYETTQTED